MSRNEYEPYPLDFEILRRLPKVGAMLGYHTLGATVKSLKRDLGSDGLVTSDQIHGRLRSLRDARLVASVRVLPVGDGLGWQITPAGETLLAQRGLGKLTAVPDPTTPDERERGEVVGDQRS